MIFLYGISIISSVLRKRLSKSRVSSYGHVQVIGRQTPVLSLFHAIINTVNYTGANQYHAYEARVGIIDRDRLVEEKLPLWGKKLSILFP